MFGDFLNKLKSLDFKSLLGIGGVGAAGVIGLYFLMASKPAPKKKKVKKTKVEEKVEEPKQEKKTETTQQAPKESKELKEVKKQKVTWEKYVEIVNTREDILNAFLFLKELAEKDKSLLVQSYLGESYMMQGLDKEGEEILNKVLLSTSKDPYDLFAIAKAYHMLKDRKKALELYNEALECPFVYSHIGVYYQYGIEVEKDENKALEYYLKGSKIGDPVAHFLAGIMMVSQQKLDEGIELCEKAAAMGYVPSLNFLKDFYRQTQQYDNFLPILFKLFSMNHVPSVVEHSMITFDKNPNESLHNLRLLAYSGRTEVQSILCDILSQTQPEIAFKYAQEFLNLSGHSDLMFKLGMYYENGVGCEKDIVKAYEFYIKASDKGDYDAMFVYGKALLEGMKEVNIEKDVQKGMTLIQESAKNGNDEALVFLQEKQ